MRLIISIDDKTAARLVKAAEETGRTLEAVAADGVSEYMLLGFKDRPDEDPAKDVE